MKVFISYAREDRERMLAIAEALRGANHVVDVDSDILLGGDDFARKLEAAIGACDACVVLWSPSSAGGKPWVPAEANLALQKGKRVISVKLAECSPPLPFSTYHMLDLTKSSDLGPLLASLAPHGAPLPVQRRPLVQWKNVLFLVLAFVAFTTCVAIVALQQPSPEAPDADPAAVAPPIVPAVLDAGPISTPDAGRAAAPVTKPKPKPPPAADPCAAQANAYAAIQGYCQNPCDLDHYPLRPDLDLCRSCDSARTQLQRCRGAR